MMVIPVKKVDDVRIIYDSSVPGGYAYLISKATEKGMREYFRLLDMKDVEAPAEAEEYVYLMEALKK